MPAKKILILSSSKDPHALIVEAGIKAKGGDVTLLCTADFPTLMTQTVITDARGMSVRISGPDLEIQGTTFDVVWHRRPSLRMPKDVLHPSDFIWAERSCRLFQVAVSRELGRNAFWVNRLSADVDKMTQQSVAQRVGMLTPKSIYSNDPAAIKSFIAEAHSGAIYKPLIPGIWKSKETGKIYSSGTKRITLEDLVDDDILSCSPGIYQELVPKAYEVRLTVFGKFVEGAKILSQDTENGKVDYREAYHELKIVPWEVPTLLKEQVFALMNDLDIRYGAFDFIVRPDGEIVFVEVNEAGQFLFIEEAYGAPLLDAFCDFLMSGDPNFTYEPSPHPLSLDEVTRGVADGYVEFERRHATPDKPIAFE